MIDAVAAPYAVLLLRWCLGAMFIAHALLKVRVFTIPGTVKFFQSLGLPGWLFSNPDGGWEYPAFWAAALFAVFLLGDGAVVLLPSPFAF